MLPLVVHQNTGGLTSVTQVEEEGYRLNDRQRLGGRSEAAARYNNTTQARPKKEMSGEFFAIPNIAAS